MATERNFRYKEVTTFKAFAWGEETIKRVVDPDGTALTSTRTFYDNQASDGLNYSRLKQFVSAEGHWERYEYGSVGRITKTVTQIGNNSVASPESSNRVVTTRYTGSNPAIEIIETLLGKEVSRRYTVYNGPNETREIRCQKVGATWDDPSNLVTVTKTYLGSQFHGELQSVKNPDGTMIFYDYAQVSNQRTNTVRTGRPNSAETDIVDGTKTVTVVDLSGNQISKETYDIATGLLLTSAKTTNSDEFGRPTRIEYNDGTFTTAVYGCCGLESETDREGITTTYDYDDLNRLTSSVRAGIATLTTYDAAGNVTSRTRQGNDGTRILQNRSGYDLAGRLVSSLDALGHKTSYSEIINPNTFTTKTTTLPNGSTRIETSYEDGSLHSVTGTAVHPLKYEYGVEIPAGESTYRSFTKEIRVGQGGAEDEWTKTYTDMLGRPYKIVHADGSRTQSFFNDKGQLVKQMDEDDVTTLFEYNGRGELEYVALDMDRDGLVDLEQTDRITRTQTDVTLAHGDKVVRRTTTTVWTTDNSPATAIIGIQETAGSSRESWNTAFGLTTHTQTTSDGIGGRTVTSTNPDGSSTASHYKDGRLLSVTQLDSSKVQIGKTTYEYDPHGRLKTSTDARNGTTTFEYDALDQLRFVTTPRPSPAETAQKTEYQYDSVGRRAKTILPDGGVVDTEYFDTGELKRTSVRVRTVSDGEVSGVREGKFYLLRKGVPAGRELPHLLGCPLAGRKSRTGRYAT